MTNLDEVLVGIGFDIIAMLMILGLPMFEGTMLTIASVCTLVTAVCGAIFIIGGATA